MTHDTAPDRTPLPLSQRLLDDGLALRHETADDLAFLERLYTAVHGDEFAATGWPDAAKHALLRQQEMLQRSQYRGNHPDADFWILVRHDESIGRLYLARGTSEYRVLDVSLMPRLCGQGIGTELLRSIGVEACAANRPVTLHVLKENPARRLYVRLGFELAGDEGPFDFMRWRPSCP